MNRKGNRSDFSKYAILKTLMEFHIACIDIVLNDYFTAPIIRQAAYKKIILKLLSHK